MKLRIKGNSIRLRLTRPDVAHLAAKGSLQEQTDFGARTFRYTLIAVDNIEGLSASFETDTIAVTAPSAAVTSWAEGDEVGIYSKQTTPAGETLTIAVEKDFRCLDRSRSEADDADAYPHPVIKIKKT